MPNIRMKRLFLRGFLWLYLLLGFGYMALSLEPGFLDFDNLPDTNFSCVGKVIGGYYADLETNCQMFHVCTVGQLEEPMDIRFLCLNGTVFDQETRVCERIDEVDCTRSEHFYGLNLELYGNTQPAILEGSPETEQPLIIKSTTTTTSTTTTKPKATNTPYHPSVTPSTVKTQDHHFPLGNSPDIRFNPEEINISLHPGAPPDIRTKQHSYSDNNKKVVVTTHSENSDSKKVSVTTHGEVFDEVPSTQKPHSSGYGYSSSHANKNFQHPTPSDINYEFTFHHTEPNHNDFHTDLPPDFFHSDFHSDQDFAGHHHSPHGQNFKSSTFHSDFTPTTKGHFQHKVPTTVRNFFLQSLKPPAPNQPHHYTNHQTEKPQRVQLPLPVLPTLSTLTFSSPAPFSLQHHIDTKRYTKDHPRIVISASASVSDASGRRLNYSLGTIGAAEFLEQPPQSYDEYKDEDVGLDPFYHDVPKLERLRAKRDIKHTDIIKSEEEAVNVLKFLFDWYKNNEKTATESTTMPTVVATHPVTSTTETAVKDIPDFTTEATEIEINAEESVAGISNNNPENSFKNSELFNKKSKFNIIGNASGEEQIKVNIDKIKTTTEVIGYEKDVIDELFRHEEDYVNDNFEPIAYNQKYSQQEEKAKKTDTVTKLPGEVKSQPLPKDYVDDNIEPIYFRHRDEIIKKSETKTLQETIVSVNEQSEDIIENTSVSLLPTQQPKETAAANTKSNLDEQTVSEVFKDSPIEIGDTETNDIKQVEEKKTNNTEPKSEILEPVTTEKVAIPMRPRSNRRRGRKRNYNGIEKDKEPEKKNVVLEKITEKAHTAKDDFNYLRTLYKVYTTTPTYNVSDTRGIEETDNTKMHTVNDDIAVKEGSPSAKFIQTTEEISEPQQDKIIIPQPQDLIPIITTDATVTTSTERLTSSSTTTETIVPPTTTTSKGASSPDILTSEISILSTTTTNENISPSTTRSVSTMATIDDLIPSSTTTIERTVPLITVTTETTISSRRDSRRRGRAKHIDNLTQNRSDLRNYRRRRPEMLHEDSKTSNKITTNNQIISIEANRTKDSATEKKDITQKDSYKDILIEENGSNINRKIIPFPITTSSTVPNNIQLDGVTEQTEFLTLLTLNYKKIFQDISQTSPPILPRVLDVSTLAVTEAVGNIPEEPSKKYKNIKLGDTPTDEFIKERHSDKGLLPPSTILPKTSSVEEIITTTITSETEYPPKRLKSESQILHNQDEHQETTTLKNMETLNTELGESLEIIPTTLSLSTEKPVITTSQSVDQDTNKVLSAPTTETLPIVDINMSTSTIENIPETSVVTEKTTEKTDNVKQDSVHDKKENDTVLDLTTTYILQKETHQTTSNPIIDYTSLIPKITEIFNFLDITKRKESIDNVPTTLLTTENSATYAPVQSTQSSNEENTDLTTLLLGVTSTETYKNFNETTTNEGIKDHFNKKTAITESYPTVYVLRTTENIETEKIQEDVLKEKGHINEENIEQTQTESYPSTVFVVRTTDTPTQIEEKLSTMQQLSTEGLHKLIEEIEENTRSVVATTNIPVMFTDHKNTVTTSKNINQHFPDKIKEILDTTERRHDLEELTSLFQYTTDSNLLITTLPNILATPREVVTETTKVPSTTEASYTHLEESPTTINSLIATDAELMSTSQIERLTITDKPLATTSSTTTTVASRRGRVRGTRPSRRRNPETHRHRFSTESFTRRPEGRRQTIEEEIIDELAKNSRVATTESYRRRLRVRPNSNGVKESSTDAPLQKSASPTQSERARESLPTTPFSKNAKRHFIFNCFGKEVDKFYPDPRDCRLFHYCTQGYNKNQLIDMKFVCDLNTYFDDVKLICSRKKPMRCL